MDEYDDGSFDCDGGKIKNTKTHIVVMMIKSFILRNTYDDRNRKNKIIIETKRGREKLIDISKCAFKQQQNNKK